MTAELPAALQYTAPSAAGLKLAYVGRNVGDIDAPAVVIDAAVVRRNCGFMHEAVRSLGVAFRAHVKTHKVCSFGALGPRRMSLISTNCRLSSCPGIKLATMQRTSD